MNRLHLFVLAAGAAVAAPPDAATVLDGVQKAYAQLRAIHVVATQTQMFSANGLSGSNEADYELAEKPPGRFRAKVRGEVEAIAVSDGSTTWKALPGAKQWMKLEVAAAAASDDDEDEPDNTRPQDLHDAVARVVLTRFPVIARIGRQAVVVKEDSVKIDGRKVPCHVVRLRVGPTQHDLWIDEERHLVLRDLQSGPQNTLQGMVKATIDTRIKKLELDNEVADTVFTFEPEKKWTQVEMLVLPGEERLMLTGRPAADFALKSLDGGQVQLSSLRGKVVVVDFWATWCPPCRAELPSLEKLKTEFTGRVEFLSVTDEDTGTVKGFLKKASYTFPVLMDSKRAVNRRYGIRAIPALLVIDREGVIRQHFVGSRSEATLRSAIQSVLTGAN